MRNSFLLALVLFFSVSSARAIMMDNDGITVNDTLISWSQLAGSPRQLNMTTVLTVANSAALVGLAYMKWFHKPEKTEVNQ